MGFFQQVLLNFKLNLTNSDNTISDMVFAGISRKDDDLLNQIEEHEKIQRHIDTFRKEHENNIFELRKALGGNKKSEILKQFEKEAKEYILNIADELKEIRSISSLSKKVLENETISILYDIRKPIHVFVQYEKSLLNSLKNLKLPDELKKSIINILTEVSQSLHSKIRETIDISRDIRVSGLPNSVPELINAMKLRTTNKKRLSGEETVLVERINNLENYFSEFKRRKMITKEDHTQILNNLASFKEAFNNLLVFYKSRIDSSGTIIEEVKLLHKKKLEELELMHKQIQKLINENKSEINLNSIATEINALMNSFDTESKNVSRDIKNNQNFENILARRTAFQLTGTERRLEREEKNIRFNK